MPLEKSNGGFQSHSYINVCPRFVFVVVYRQKSEMGRSPVQGVLKSSYRF